MLLFYWITGVLLGGVWLWQLANVIFGMPRVVDISQPAWDAAGTELPRLTVIVPARNEAEHIRDCLTSLLSLDYPALEIIAVNDRSSDATGAIMDEVAATPLANGRLRIIHVTELPDRWLGKTHAMWKAASQATGDWTLFTDGDVHFRPDTLRRAVAYAEKDRADHVVLYPTMILETPGERMMISYFLNNISFIHRPWKIADPKARDFVGAGAFNLIRRSTYQAIGTYESMRLAIVDDLALGYAVKSNGFAQRAVRGRGMASLHWAKGSMGVVNNLTKNFFALMRYQWFLTVGASIGSAFIGLGPLLGLIFAPGAAKSGFAIALSANALVYIRMKYFTGVSPVYFFTHPLACVLVIYTMLRSTFVTLWDGGVTWRGTKYSLDELRSK
jgi:glycosyltransferase involved in cell wall biosynthesis